LTIAKGEEVHMEGGPEGSKGRRRKSNFANVHEGERKRRANSDILSKGEGGGKLGKNEEEQKKRGVKENTTTEGGGGRISTRALEEDGTCAPKKREAFLSY